MITRLFVAVALVGCLLFAAIQSCGPDQDPGLLERTPVVSFDCPEGVCTLLVHYASEVRLYDTLSLDAHHLWEDYQGYVTERRLTYRFPVPEDTGVVVAEACNPYGVCIRLAEFVE